MKKIYIAGPMRGLPDLNFPAFDRAALHFGDCGYFVFNPSDMDRAAGDNADDPPFIADCMKRDLNVICECTDIALLRGWPHSAGVRPEVALAHLLKLNFHEENEIGFFVPVSRHYVAAIIGQYFINNYFARTK
jgi:hypothetical protein